MAQARETLSSADNLHHSVSRENVHKAHMNATIVTFMHNMWRENKMCDVVLATADDDLFAHKLMLGAFSDILLSTFSNEPHGRMPVINLPQYSTDIVHQILEFIYTSDITVTDTNISDLIGCAMQLDIAIMIDKCMEHLRSYNTSNALLYYSITETYNIQELQNRLFSFICEQFEEISRVEAFLHIPYATLLLILKDDRLLAMSELDIFHAMMRWLNYNRQERLYMLPDLMGCVRLSLISPNMLVSHVQAVDDIFNIKECHDQLYTAMW